MLSLLSLLLVILISILVVKVAAVALTLTGLSAEAARFQARSAFTGSGFTTQESESVVGHPVRRRVVMLLMLLGNAGLVTAVTSLLLSFSGSENANDVWYEKTWFHLIILFLAIYLLWRISSSDWFDARLTRVIEWALHRWTKIDVRDYVSLFRLSGDFAISEIIVEKGDWLAGNTLADLRLNHEGVLVLGIERADGRYVGAPRGATELEPGDKMILYGRGEVLVDIDERRPDLDGFTAFVRSCKKQAALEQEEDAVDEQTESAAAPSAETSGA